MGSETEVKAGVGRRKSYSELYARILELEQTVEEKDEQTELLRTKVERQQTLLSHRMQCITQLQQERSELRKQNSELIAKMAEVSRRNSVSGNSPPISFRRRRATPPPITISNTPSPGISRRMTELPPIPASPSAEETSPPERSPSPSRLSPRPTNRDSETDYSDMDDDPVGPKQPKLPKTEKKRDNKEVKTEAAKEDSRKENPTSLSGSWVNLQPGGKEKSPDPPQPGRRSGLQALSTPMPALAPGGHMPLRRISGSRSPSPDCVPVSSEPAPGPDRGPVAASKDPPASNRSFFGGSSKQKKSVKKESKRKERAKSPRPNSKGKGKGKDTKTLDLPNGNVSFDEKAGLKKTISANRESISDIVFTIESNPTVDRKAQEDSVLSSIMELSTPEISARGERFDWKTTSELDFSSPQLSPEKGAAVKVKRTSPPPEITGNIDGSIGPSQTKKNKRVVINPNLDQHWGRGRPEHDEEEDEDGDGSVDQPQRYRNRAQTVSAFGGQRRKPKQARKGGNRMMLRRQSSFSDRMRDRKMIQIKDLELFSPDVEARIRARVCRAIGEKYGGCKRASEAAVTIQRAYRDYKLKKRFEEIRREATKMRKRAETMQLDSRRRLSVARKRQQDRKDPLLRAREAAVKLSQERRGHTSERKKLQARGSLVEFPILEASPEMSGDLETAVCVIPIGYDSDLEERPKLKFQISGTTAGESTTDPSSLGASQPSAFPSDELYQHHRPSVFSASVSADDLDRLRKEVERERALKKRKYSAATFQQKTTVGVNHFNRKPTKGVQYLVLEGVLEDDPRSVAEFLLKHYGLSKEKIGEFLGEISKDFNMAVLECLVELVDLKEKPIDDALRQFQEIFRMPGEAQKIDKIMQVFALEYYRNNQAGAIKSEDGAYMLSFAIMMLHTALHNPSVRHRTTTKQWVSMNRGCNDGENFPEPFLLDIYERIKRTEFATGHDHTHVVAQIEKQITGSTLSKLAIPQRRFIFKVSVAEVLDVNKSQGYKNRHRRTMFLFSDLVIVCKNKGSDQFIFRESFSLLNALGLTFDTEHYKYGIQIYSSLDKKAIFYCNCDSAADRTNFLSKFDETIAELCELETERIAELGFSLGQKKESTGTRHLTSNAGDLLSTAKLPGSYDNFRGKEKDGKDFVPGVGDIAMTTRLTQGLLKRSSSKSKSRNRSSGDSGFDSQQTTPVGSPSPTESAKSQVQAAALKSPKISLTQPEAPSPPPTVSPTAVTKSLPLPSTTPPRSRSSDQIRSLTITPNDASLLGPPSDANGTTRGRQRRGSETDADVQNLKPDQKKRGREKAKTSRRFPSPFRKRATTGQKEVADARVKRSASHSLPSRETSEVSSRAKSHSPSVPKKADEDRPNSIPDFTTLSDEI